MIRYPDTVSRADVPTAHQVELVCACGHRIGPAWARWPLDIQRTPLRQLQPRMKCEKCGARGPTVRIYGFGGGGSEIELWRWPRWDE